MDAGLTRTIFATRTLPRPGDEVVVYGEPRELPLDGAYRTELAHVVAGRAPLLVTVPGAHPVRWIAADAALSVVVVMGHFVAILPAVIAWSR